MIAENPGRALADVLGPAASYAEEMRSASGLTAATHRHRSLRARFAKRLRRWTSGAAVFTRDLRAVGWAIRGAAVGAFLLVAWQSIQIMAREHDMGITGYLLSREASERMLAQRWGAFLPMFELVAALGVGVGLSVWLGGWMGRRAVPGWLRACVLVAGVLVVLWFAGVCFVLVADGMIESLADPNYANLF